jgi:uncharacterized protein YneF (UPF0154 family)
MVVYAKVMTGLIHVRYIRKGMNKKIQDVPKLMENKLQGHILKMGCIETDSSHVDCWIHTSQNLIYVATVQIIESTGGVLTFKDKKLNKYKVGLNQFITGCSITKGFLVCTSDDLSSKDPNHRSSILVFRTSEKLNNQTMFLYNEIPAKDISGVTPYISTIDFEDLPDPTSRRRLLRILEDTDKLPKSQKATLFGSGDGTIKKYAVTMNPTLIKVTEDNLHKNPKFNQTVVVVKDPSGVTKEWSFAKFIPNPKPPKPENETNKEPVDPPLPPKKGIGFFGWLFVVLMILLVAYGIWFFMRREQLKEQAREDLMYNTNELEKYD